MAASLYGAALCFVKKGAFVDKEESGKQPETCRRRQDFFLFLELKNINRAVLKKMKEMFEEKWKKVKLNC